jgi:hypothetical protein
MCATAQTRGARRFTFHRIVQKLNTPSVVSTPVPEGRHGRLELNLADYNVNGASIGCGRDGTKFAFTIGPISDTTVAALEGMARKHGRICLYSCRQPLLFDLVVVERKERHRVRILGRIVGGNFDLMGSIA